MKAPRFSPDTVGIVSVLFAIDFAVVWTALFGPESESVWSIFALCLLPMANTLTVVLYRLRRRERRTAGAFGFLTAGTVATLVVFMYCLTATETALSMFGAFMNVYDNTFGHFLTYGLAMRVIFGVGLGVLFPMAFFCAPPLAAAFLGGWLARRLVPEKPVMVLRAE